MRRSRFILVLLLAFGGLSCVTVQPWERGVLAHDSMNPASASAACSDDFVRHTFDIREGASGGAGHAGGGCGCN